MKSIEKVAVIDFGGQYSQLIARRIRDLGVYSELYPHSVSLEELKKENLIGIVCSGGPQSVYLEESLRFNLDWLSLRIPVLGICYGCQALTYALKGEVTLTPNPEYGQTKTEFDVTSPLFLGLRKESMTFMSHQDYVKVLPAGFHSIAHTAVTENAAFADDERKIYGVQFHPEVHHTEEGNLVLKNFLANICQAKFDYRTEDFIAETVEALRKQVGDKEVILGLSGGVDSTVAAALLEKAIGPKLHCVFVDHGLLRYQEAELVKSVFADKSRFQLDFIPVDAKAIFLGALKGVTEPEQKRKIIGHTFIDVFRAEREKLPQVSLLAQGTIYPDRIESGMGKSAAIKSHHNVGGLPKDIGFDGLVEPLRDLFKDEVRKVGMALGLPAEIVYRQPFPGPGLAIRIIGEITEEKIDLVQRADYIFRSMIDESPIKGKASQYFVALSNMKSVGVQGDFRTYSYAAVIRCVATDDFMTAEPLEIPFSLLRKISDRICNEVKGINRVLYDCTSKPPATIELE